MAGLYKIEVTTCKGWNAQKKPRPNAPRVERAAPRTESVERGGRAEELVAALRFGHAERLQMLLHRLHERLRPEEVGIDIAVLRQPRIEQRFVDKADAVRFEIAIALVLVAVEALQLRMARRQFLDRRTERVHAAVPRRVDEVHRALRFERG